VKRAPLFTLVFAIISAVLITNSAAAHESKPYPFGFKKSKDGQLPSIAQEGFMDILQKQDATKKSCISPLITDMKMDIPARS
jgi:peptidoglycan-N-acetylmuramic acid deacetylase